MPRRYYIWFLHTMQSRRKEVWWRWDIIKRFSRSRCRFHNWRRAMLFAGCWHAMFHTLIRSLPLWFRLFFWNSLLFSFFRDFATHAIDKAFHRSPPGRHYSLRFASKISYEQAASLPLCQISLSRHLSHFSSQMPIGAACQVSPHFSLAIRSYFQ